MLPRLTLTCLRLSKSKRSLRRDKDQSTVSLVMNLLVMNLFIAIYAKKTAKSDWVSGKKEVIFCSDI